MKREREVYNTNRYFIVLALMLVSLINKTTLTVSMVVMCLYYCVYESSDGAVKALVLLTIRSIFSTGVGVSIGSISTLKWILLMGLSAYVFIGKGSRSPSFALFLRAIIPYAMLIAVMSLLNSCYPLVSIFKLFAWAFVFSAVVYGVYDSKRIDWIGFLLLCLGTVLVVSLGTLPLSLGFLRNGRGFQGITNHPNLYGLICAISFTVGMTYEWKSRNGKPLFLSLCGVEAFMTRSRTSVFTIVIVIVYYLFSADYPLTEKIIAAFLMALVLGMVFAIIYINDPNHEGSIWQFIFKGHDENLLYSRTEQFGTQTDRFADSPIIGNGFMTPWKEGVRSWSFSFDLQIEPGNLVLSVLGQTGLVGMVAFLAVFIYLYSFTPKHLRIVYLTPFIMCMGEMVFFSTNNIAVLLFVLFGVCFQPQNRVKKKGGSNEKATLYRQYTVPVSR